MNQLESVITIQEVQSTHVQIGRFAFDSDQALLVSQSGDCHFLRPKTARVMSLLVARSGQLVRKADLVEHAWPDTAVTEDSLTQCIADIRRVLGPDERKLLKTVPRRGYILHAARSAPDMAQSGATSQTDVSASAVLVFVDALPAQFTAQTLKDLAARHRAKPLTKVSKPSLWAMENAEIACAFATGLLRAASLADPTASCRISLNLDQRSSESYDAGHLPELLWQMQRLAKEVPHQGIHASPELMSRLNVATLSTLLAATEDSHRNSALQPNAHSHQCDRLMPTLIILPPVDRSVAQAGTLLSQVLTDELQFVFSQARDVHVISRLSGSSLSTHQTDLKELHDRFGIDFALTGSFSEAKGRVLFAWELTDTTTGRSLVAEKSRFDVQQLIAGECVPSDVTSKVWKAICRQQITLVRRQNPKTLEAYTRLLAAIGLMHRLNPEDLSLSWKLLSDLIQSFPNFPVIHAWMARWFVLRGAQGWASDPMYEAQIALDHAQRALDLDPDCHVALTSEGNVRLTLFQEMDEAQRCYDEALAVNPNDPYALALRGTLCAFKGEGQGAINDTDLALHLAPCDPNRHFYLAMSAGAHLAAGDNRSALECAEASLRINRTHLSAMRIQAVSQHRLGLADAARKTAETLMQVQPDFRVRGWKNASPSADHPIGMGFARTLQKSGIPE